MTDPTEIARIAKGLSERQRKTLLWLSEKPQSWPKGSEVSLYCMARMIDGDPEKAPAIMMRLCKDVGRSEGTRARPCGDTLWVATPLGLAVRDHLAKEGGK